MIALVQKAGPQHMGIAVEILLLSCILEITLWARHVFTSTFGYRPPFWIPNALIRRTTPVVLPDFKNMGLAVGIRLPSCIQAELYAIFIYTFGEWRPSSIPHVPRLRKVIVSVQSCDLRRHDSVHAGIIRVIGWYNCVILLSMDLAWALLCRVPREEYAAYLYIVLQF